MKKIIATILLVFVSGTVNVALAESKVIKLPGDTKLVVFPFDPNNTYTLLVRPGTVTDIQLGPDEQFSTLALGDTVNFSAAKPKTGGHVFIRAMLPDQETSGTLITSMRSYQLTLRSTSKGSWYQRVSWSYPDIIIMEDGGNTPLSNSGGESLNGTTSKAVQVAPTMAMPSSSPEGGMPYNLNFDYQISGQAEFRPTRVYDNGKFTFIDFPPKMQQLPAFFILEGGEPEVVPFIVMNGSIKVQRLFAEGVLRLGEQVVNITNLAAKQGGANLGFWNR